MEHTGPILEFHLLGVEIGITSSIIIQWVVIALLALLSIMFTRNLKKIPDKKQSVLELLVTTVQNLVKENMGEEYKSFVPYIGTLAIYILVLNLVPLVGIKSPTEDLSVTLGFGIITFIVIQVNAIKKIGLAHYLSGYTKPLAPLAPMNIIERVMLPVSLSLRLFGNITAGAVILGLLYDVLGSFSVFAQIAIPVPIHLYFDLFDGAIQMVIFVMLTMINIKVIADH